MGSKNKARTVKTCSACNGRGWTNRRRTSGYTVSDPCRTCRGTGVVYG